MASKLTKRDATWFVTTKKYPGRTLEYVAGTDPEYLTWMWSDLKTFSTLSEEAQNELQKVMEEYGIPF